MTSVVYRAAAGRDFDAITLKIAEDNPAIAIRRFAHTNHFCGFLLKYVEMSFEC